MGHQVPVPTFRMSLLTGKSVIADRDNELTGKPVIARDEVRKMKRIKHKRKIRKGANI